MKYEIQNKKLSWIDNFKFIRYYDDLAKSIAFHCTINTSDDNVINKTLQVFCGIRGKDCIVQLDYESTKDHILIFVTVTRLSDGSLTRRYLGTVRKNISFNIIISRVNEFNKFSISLEDGVKNLSLTFNLYYNFRSSYRFIKPTLENINRVKLLVKCEIV